MRRQEVGGDPRGAEDGGGRGHGVIDERQVRLQIAPV